MSRLAPAVMIAAFLGVGVSAGASKQAEAAQHRTRLLGCLAQTSDGTFQLTPTVRGTARATGSSSAKGSTPLGHPVSAEEQPRPSGVMTSKGSTPVPAVPVSYTPPTARGTNSPKSSTPVGHARTAPYVLDAVGIDLTEQIGRVVEVVGGLQKGVLKLEAIRPLAGNCAP